MTRRYGVLVEGPRRPFTPDEVSDWLGYSWSNKKRRLVAETPLLAGLKPTELAHIHPEWREWRDGTLYIQIPPKAPCNASHDEDPCDLCHRRDGIYTPEVASRWVPVFDDELSELIDNFFSLYGNELTWAGVNQMYLRVRDQGPIDREFKFHALRYTYVVALGAKGFDDDEIRAFTGYAPTERKVVGWRKLGQDDDFERLKHLGTGEFRE